MSKAVPIYSQSLRYLRQTPAAEDPRACSRDFTSHPRVLTVSSSKSLSLSRKSSFFLEKIPNLVLKEAKSIGVFKEGSVKELVDDDDAPVSIDLHPIISETQFDQIIAEAQQIGVSVIILWMATWCRKCIYLKPKLEKLAADYYPRLRFYKIDVNNVPHSLVARAGVIKMPTVQVWKDGEKQGEVIGGHKAYLVINEVREMIEKECTV